MSAPRWLAAALVVAAMLGGTLVLAQRAPAWHGTGVVVALLPAPSSLHATRPVIVIDHDPIPELMDEEMIMPFIAASADLFHGLRVGDRIAFDLADTPDALLVVGVRRLPPASAPHPRR